MRLAHSATAASVLSCISGRDPGEAPRSQAPAWMQLTTFSVRTRVSHGLRAASAIDDLRLQSQVSKPLDRNSDVSRVNLDAVTCAAELVAGNERGAGAA